MLKLKSTVQILPLLLVMFSFATANAQKYTVYKVSGKVFSINNATAKPLRQNDTLTDKSRVRINQDSELWLSEKKGAIYKLKKATGRKGASVGELVKSAKNHIRTSISDINTLIISNISVNKTQGNKFSRTGAGHVITNTSGIKTLLASLIGPDDITMQNDNTVKVKKISDGDGLFHFSFKNECDDNLYANIILKDCDEEDIEFLLPENILLRADKITDLPDMQFLIPVQPFAGFILILSNERFTIEDIRKELDVMTQDISRDFVYKIIR